MMAIVGMLTFNFNTVLPLLVKHTFHQSDAGFTLLLSVTSVGSLVGALATARRTHVTIHHVVIGSAAFGVSMLALAAMPNLWACLPVGVLVGASSIAFMTSSTAIVQMRTDPAMRGRVLALQAIVFLGSTPIGGPLLGAICQYFGARMGVVIGGLGAIGAALWGHHASRSLSMPAAEPTVASPLVS
jgi:MFS family permease